MNYQRTNRPSRKTAKILIGTAVVLVLLRLIVPHAFAAFFADVFSPLWRLENVVGRGPASGNQIIFSSDSSFASSTVAELLQENNDLKNMLGRPLSGTGSASQNTIVSAVLSKSPFSAYDSLIVDAGSNQGVTVGDKVYALANPVVYSTTADLPPTVSSSSASLSSTTTSTTAAKKNSSAHTVAAIEASSSSSATVATSTNPQIEIPIGTVAATYGNTSVVTLFSSPGQTYPVQIGSYHIAATADAQGSGMFAAMIPNNSNINVGDPVMIPSIQTGVFASVVSVVSDPARPYSLVLFQSPVDPFSLYMVEVQKASGNPAVTK